MQTLRCSQRGLSTALAARPARLVPGVLRGPARQSRLPTPQFLQQPRPLLAPRQATGGQSTAWNPVEVVKREQGLQSNKLPNDVREKVTQAIEQLRYRVTVGDVAARAGVKVTEADDALKALAYDSQAALEVSEQGDVVYNFPRNFRSAIQSKSVWLSALPVLRGISNVGQYLVRVMFGTALVSSIAIVWLAIAVLLSSRGDRDDRRSQGSGGRYYNGYTSYSGGGFGPRFYFDLTDLLIYLDPNYNRVSHERLERGNQLSFVEAIFSFVFGDGDPNAEYDAERYAALGQYIQNKGGVVTAEEMAPFLDPPVLKQGEKRYTDESFVLPALIRFGGEPEVDSATGTILYKFPTLQASGVTSEWVRGRGAQSSAAVEVPQEKTWDLTAASAGQIMGVVALGLVNVIGVLTLSGLLADPQASYALMYNGLGWVAGLMPFLQVYAAALFGIPLLRTAFNAKTNGQISERNDARAQAVRLLNSGAQWLKEKLSAARQEGSRRTVRKADVIYTTDRETGEQMNERDARDWDRKLLSNANARPTYPTADGLGREAPLYPGAREAERVAQEPRRDTASRGPRGQRDFDGNWR